MDGRRYVVEGVIGPRLPWPRPTLVTKIHQAAMLASRFHFFLVAGPGPDTLIK